MAATHHTSLERTVAHLHNNVLPSVDDYYLAEQEVTVTWDDDPASDEHRKAQHNAKRYAANLAIAIDGLAERFAHETASDEAKVPEVLGHIRAEIEAICAFPGSPPKPRAGALSRIRGVANVHKHQKLRDPKLPISSEDDVLVVGSGFGIDAFGVGKPGGPEVLINDKNLGTRKFLGDAPAAILAWVRFLRSHNATGLKDHYSVIGLNERDFAELYVDATS